MIHFKSQLGSLDRTAIFFAANGLAGFLALGQAASPVASEDSSEFSEPPLRLEDVVVTATRGPKPSSELPFVLERKSTSEIRNESMAASVPEALLSTPGVMIQQTGRGQGSPFLRGFTGFRTVALVDGIRLNNSTFRDGPNQYWSTIDALAVHRLEVVKGPASVLYGSDAIGGAANALMRGPSYGFAPGPFWSGATYYRFGSAERAHLGRGELGISERDHWGVFLGISGKTFGDLQGGREVGRQRNTGYDQYDLDGKAEFFLSPQTKLTLAHQHTQQDDVQRTHRTIDGLNWEGLQHGSELQHPFDQRRDLTYARLETTAHRGDRFQATTSWHMQHEFESVERGNQTRDENKTDARTFGLSLQGESPSRIGLWTYGAEFYRDWVDSSRRSFDAAGQLASVAIQGPVADDSTYDLFGVFVQDDVPLGERVEFIAGGRFTWAQADAGRVRSPLTGMPTSFSQDWQEVVGSGRLLWHLDEAKSWTLFGGAAQGFRAPNLSDLTRFDIARGNELETAAFDLQPEQFITVDGGIKARQGRWNAELSYYHTFINDLIVRAPTGAIISGSPEVTKRNAGEGFVHGVEFDARFDAGAGFTFYGSVAWQEGEADAFPTSAPVPERAPLTRQHPLNGLAGVRWDSLKPRLPLFAEFFSVLSARQDRLSPEDLRDTQRIPPGGTPGWFTLNLRAGYSWKTHTRLVAALENLTNEDYRIHGSGFNQPGRNFKLSVEYRF